MDKQSGCRMFSLAILGRVLQLQKGFLISIPEVESVVGETGRGDGVRKQADIEEPKSVKHAATRFLRMWPFGLYVLLCLTIAYYLPYIVQFTGLNVALIFGLGSGGLSILAVLAGLCGRSFIRGIAAASCIAATVFVTTFIGEYFAYLKAYCCFAFYST